MEATQPLCVHGAAKVNERTSSHTRIKLFCVRREGLLLRRHGWVKSASIC